MTKTHNDQNSLIMFFVLTHLQLRMGFTLLITTYVVKKFTINTLFRKDTHFQR